MLELKVNGMTCEHCVAAVGRAVREVPGVTEVMVDREHGVVQVGGTPDVIAVQGAITAEGYEVG